MDQIKQMGGAKGRRSRDVTSYKWDYTEDRKDRAKPHFPASHLCHPVYLWF